MAAAGLTIASPATSQGTPGCPGCMPKIQRIWDSTHVTPAPSFTTSASTGAVHIPPRIVEVQVPAPPPVNTDRASFSLPETFICIVADGFGKNAARAVVLRYFKDIGGRCPDSGGLEHFTTAQWNCSTGHLGDELASKLTANGHRALKCDVMSHIERDIKTQADIDATNRFCSNSARGQGYANHESYRYVRGPNSDVCSRV